jgi:Spy/CpxP family protein refolding chaperone
MSGKTTVRTTICILGISLLLFAGSLAAQQPHNPDPVAENLFAPELVMANQKAIGLDEAQRNYIRAELLKAQTRFTELQWQLQDQMESLLGLLKQNPVDEAQVLAQLEKVLSVEREVKRAQITLMVRIKNKLTPEQQAQLRKLRAESAPR